MTGSVIFVYALNQNSHLNCDVTYQSLIGFTVHENKMF